VSVVSIMDHFTSSMTTLIIKTASDPMCHSENRLLAEFAFNVGRTGAAGRESNRVMSPSWQEL
jgi:hypothetical protein